MRQGTASVLFGCHSVVHSLVVAVAWRKHYGRWPAWWQIVCILLHDVGHWGKDYLNNYAEKKSHAELGARIAGILFGPKGRVLVSGHNAYEGQVRSDLYFPDKYSWVIAPLWWMASNTWFEPKLQRNGSTRWESAVMFKEAMRQNMKDDFSEQGHDIYLRQWGHSMSGDGHH